MKAKINIYGRIKDFFRPHLGFIVFFASVIFLFLGRLIFMKAGMLSSDYLAQFYPWSRIYSEAIRSFRFPFWTRYFHSGFPLMAEGQIGGFYPLNMLIFFILPFDIAYNYSVILHFILAGIFTYLYSRRIDADQWGASLAALLFCFGSAYAGCFYNIVTLKTLIWFPLVLLLMEDFFDSKRRVYIIACGIIAGVQFLAGFIQMAVYALVFYIIYLLYGFRIKRIGLKERMLAFIIFTLACVIIALPQLLLTYQLAQASGRAFASLGFALWKSFPPPCFLSVFFPRWMSFLGQQIFIGALSILFLIYALMQTKDRPEIRPLILVGIVSILAALGRYNPLYVAMLKITGFYSFRNPSKLLFFALFAASALSGFGFSKLFNRPDKGRIRSAAKIFSIISGIFLAIFFAGKFVLPFFRTGITGWLKDYCFKYVIGKPYHRYDLQAYMGKINSIYLSLKDGTSFSDIFVLFSVIMAIAGILIAVYIYIRPDKVRLLRLPLFCLIFLDIFVYSFYGTGFRGNIEPFEYAGPCRDKIIEALKSDKGLFRVAPFDLKDERMPHWAMPQTNILYEIDSIAAYTPLVESNYKDKLSSLEVIDDALGLLSPSDEALVDKYQLLRLLNVKYLVSPRRLNYGFLERIVSDGGVFLYRLKDYLPRAFFTYKIDGDIREALIKNLEIVEYKSGFLKVELTADRDGFLVFSENYYPGWRAYVDGNRAEIILVKDIVQAVRIDKGNHKIIFRFIPQIFKDRV